LQVPAADVIDWVYSLQVLPLAADDPRSSAANKGMISTMAFSPSWLGMLQFYFSSSSSIVNLFEIV
jgi:hypothetical protein